MLIKNWKNDLWSEFPTKYMYVLYNLQFLAFERIQVTCSM